MTKFEMALVALTLLPGCDGSDLTVGNPLPPKAGDVYEGYVEGGWKFASGSDRLAITFTSASAGTVWFGAPPDPNVPLLDPARKLPKWYVENERLLAFGTDESAFRSNAERFAFTLRDVAVEGDRLRFAVDIAEAFTSWCSEQTSVPSGSNSYLCYPNSGTLVGPDGCALIDPATETRTPVECAKITLCRTGICSCSASGCTVAGPGLNFDIRFGNTIDGTTELGAIRLLRR